MIWSTRYKQSGGNDVASVLLIIVPAFLSVVVSFASLLVRFRASTGDERLQLKWFVAGGAAVAATFIVGTFADSPLVSIAQSLAVIFFFVAVGVAILKYRLYEIDVVISKTVLYGLLAAFFTAVYVAIVVGIGTAIGSTHNPFLTVLAVTLIALAFNPARARAKWLANSIAYGKRATPYEVLSEFAEDMAGTYSLEDVLPRTAQMLAEGTGATRADVWLLSRSELVDETTWPPAPKLDRIAATNGDDVHVPGASRAVPVRHQGELLGAISIYKAAGDPVSAVGDKLLSDVASQAGLVLRNVRLVEDLKASRQRIVTAQDEERRKIERNIHGGAQQQLVALAIKANLAKSLVGRDEEEERAMLEQLRADAQDTLENLRDLARGIYPPLLADQGLVRSA
jgi:signal transduction histidine kinase